LSKPKISLGTVYWILCDILGKLTIREDYKRRIYLTIRSSNTRALIRKFLLNINYWVSFRPQTFPSIRSNKVFPSKNNLEIKTALQLLGDTKKKKIWSYIQQSFCCRISFKYKMFKTVSYQLCFLYRLVKWTPYVLKTVYTQKIKIKIQSRKTWL